MVLAELTNKLQQVQYNNKNDWISSQTYAQSTEGMSFRTVKITVQLGIKNMYIDSSTFYWHVVKDGQTPTEELGC